MHVVRGKGRTPISAAVPLVLDLPDLPVLALDATGDPRLLELASGRPVELIEGELTASLHGVHLAVVMTCLLIVPAGQAPCPGTLGSRVALGSGHEHAGTGH